MSQPLAKLLLRFILLDIAVAVIIALATSRLARAPPALPPVYVVMDYVDAYGNYKPVDFEVRGIRFYGRAVNAALKNASRLLACDLNVPPSVRRHFARLGALQGARIDPVVHWCWCQHHVAWQIYAV